MSLNLPGIWSFLLDENMDFRLKRDMRTAGYSAVHVTDIGLSNVPDTLIFAHAVRNQFTIMTSDTDYLLNRTFPPPHWGILVVRLGNAPTLRHEVVAAIQHLAQRGENLADAVWIVALGGTVTRQP